MSHKVQNEKKRTDHQPTMSGVLNFVPFFIKTEAVYDVNVGALRNGP
jgi:hypothetical protein